jgi:3-oxoacyl-[acyl-carrier protein] reductase
MDLQLDEKVALVCAASRGLGKATARQLAGEGARVVMCARGAEIDKAAVEIGEETGADVLPVRADVTVPEDIARLVQATLDRFGRIDILIVNAGGPSTGTFLELAPEDWEKAVQLTLMSAVRLCYAVVPHMLDQGSGSIVALESYTVKEPAENLILSNSLRMAVIGMLKTMANELGPEGIRINSLNPTYIYTERAEQILQNRADRKGTAVEEEAERVVSTIPLGRMGHVEEFGRAAAWLASPAASFIHGQALIFDGGATRAAL